jgi:hypothetical protein
LNSASSQSFHSKNINPVVPKEIGNTQELPGASKRNSKKNSNDENDELSDQVQPLKKSKKWSSTTNKGKLKLIKYTLILNLDNIRKNHFKHNINYNFANARNQPPQ